jgi:hypothetical protein
MQIRSIKDEIVNMVTRIQEVEAMNKNILEIAVQSS